MQGRSESSGGTTTRNGRKTVVLVGHCLPDAWALKSAVRNAVGSADVRGVAEEDGLDSALEQADLLLVNRVLDGDFEDRDGVDLIRRLAGREGAPPVMLVSNFEDAQAAARAAGAMPGFGKTHLYDALTRDRIAEALGG